MKPLKTIKIYPKEKKYKYFGKWYKFIQKQIEKNNDKQSV